MELHDKIKTEFKPEDKKGFTYVELMEHHIKNLENIEESMKKHLQLLQKNKMNICTNILSLQGLIETELKLNKR